MAIPGCRKVRIDAMGYAVTQKGQVTLPKPVRERLGVTPGEEVEFRLGEQGEVIIEKASGERRHERFARWRGFFGPGPSTDEIMAMTRGEDR
jgi:AbrB family looped-hinge helix DNA binding protein